MNKITITNAVISKGYDNKEALRFNNENKTAVQFKISERVYDSKAPDKYRYINYAVKAFSPLSERIDKMKFKEGSRINISGRLDEEHWEDKGQKFSRFVIISDEIEYVASDGSKSNGNGTTGAGSASPSQNGNGTTAQNPSSVQQQENSPENETEMPSGFIGYESFNNGSDKNVFFPD